MCCRGSLTKVAFHDVAGDKFEGQGQYEYVNGSTYVGEWKAGKKHGQVCLLALQCASL